MDWKAIHVKESAKCWSWNYTQEKEHTHIHSHIYSLSLSPTHTHTHTKRMQDYWRSRGGLSFLCFLHVLGPQCAECCLQVVDIHTPSYLRHRGQVFADSVLGSRNPQVPLLYLFPQICPPDPTSFEQQIKRPASGSHFNAGGRYCPLQTV